MPCCVAYNCSNKPGRVKDAENTNISFHRFPISDREMTKEWVTKIHREGFIPSASSVVCSKHFEEKHLYRFGSKVTLRDGAIPTLFDLPPHLQKHVKPRKAPTERHSFERIPDNIDHISDHSYCSYTFPEETASSLKRKHDIEITKLKKKLKTSQQKTRRLRKKIDTLQTIVDNLKNKRLITDSCAELLESSFSGLPQKVMKKMLSNQHKQLKGSNTFSPEIRSFAMTLQFYSAKAYKYVRKTFDFALPHPNTIRRWYSKIPADPGFTEASFIALKTKVEAAKQLNKEVICALMIDEMSIRKHVQWDGNKFRGYVDMGCSQQNDDDDSTPQAKDALVFMVVAVNGHWKVPCAYFLIDGLNGEERANLVSECLQRLHSVGVKVISLTCDGPSCHFSMFQALGTKPHLPSLKTDFPHPSDENQNVYILLDICHMLKLVRNTLASGGIIKNKDGGIIRWEYFVELNQLQNTEGLRLANKIRNSHIHFQQQKMKVNLAAQILSSSVADALEYCSQILKLEKFADCMATVEFIRIFDKLFDLFNSKNNFQKGLKSPLRKCNFTHWNSFLIYAFGYISGLQTTTGVLMTSTRKKTGFIGFLIAIKSFQGIFRKLITETHTLDYLLTYKFSQDHIELFFAAIRSSGGTNNNPTAQQFCSAYRRLLVRSVEGGKGNCTKLDATKALFVGDIMKINEEEKSVNDIHIIRRYNLDGEETLAHDHNYFSGIPDISKPILSEFQESVVGYISGYVVRMVKKQIVCFECIDALTDNHHCESTLVKFKDRGGLIKPANDVINLCCQTEKCINQIISKSKGNLPHGKHLLQTIITTVIRRSNITKLFPQLENHLLDSSIHNSLANHLYTLVKLIIKSYATIKLHHVGKQKNEEKSHEKARKKLSKLILFKHQ